MNDGTHLVWNTHEQKKVFEGPIFDVLEMKRTSNDGRSGAFISLDAPKWVTVIPWYKNKDGIPYFKMVRQYRHGSEKVTIEFPAGTVDEGEDVMVAGKRELLEETGCIPHSQMVLLGSISPNPAFMNNRVWFYLVEGLECVNDQHLDENEQVDILEIPVEEVLREMGHGEYDNGIMMIAQGFFLRYAKDHGGLL
ncbi:MAG: NUDIX hydrolase [Spirochaetia bacterium]|nr:NUDIX hydrolase [Spirochaetia bacterium]